MTVISDKMSSLFICDFSNQIVTLNACSTVAAVWLDTQGSIRLHACSGMCTFDWGGPGGRGNPGRRLVGRCLPGRGAAGRAQLQCK